MVVKTKIRKKRWFKILATPMFNSKNIGETMAFEPTDLVGRPAPISLMNLTGDFKRQSTKIVFEIDSVKDDTAITHVRKYEMSNSAIRRSVRKDREKIELSFVLKTSDGRTIVIKPFLIVKKSIGGAQMTMLRKKTLDFLKTHIGKITFDNLLKDVIMNKLQKDIKIDLNKIYPLKACEIKVLELKKIPKTPVKEEVKEQPKEELKKELEEQPKEEVKAE